jgi:hypothetical protein
VVHVPAFRQTLKPPPITLQQALRIAEKYIAENKIDIRQYWLEEARLLQPEGATPWNGSRWFFFWNNLRGGRGDYVEIEIDMNGNCVRMPSM